MVGWPSQRADRSLEALPEGRDGTGGPTGGLVGVRSPSQCVLSPSRSAGRGQEAFPQGRAVSGES